MDHPRNLSSRGSTDQATVGQLVRQACLWEATAPKPGNVHPGAAFADTCYEDFILSAEAILPAMEAASSLGVGRAIFQAVTATRSLVTSNTNLGLILLLAPLAAVPRHEPLRPGVRQVLDTLARRIPNMFMRQFAWLNQVDSAMRTTRTCVTMPRTNCSTQCGRPVPGI